MENSIRTHVSNRIHGRLHVCPWQLAFILDMGVRRWLESPVKILKPYIKKGDVVCDFGCGSGFFSIPAAQMAGANGQVHAVDLQPEMLNLLQKKAESKDLIQRFRFHQGFIDSIKFSKPIDLVLAFYVVHELPDPQHFIKTAFRILKNGGRLYVIEPVFHAPKKQWKQIIDFSLKMGFTIVDHPSLLFSRIILFEKQNH